MYSDFSGENGQTWYRNIDKLIHHVNAHGVINLLYSTPSIYTAAKIATTPLPVRDEDVMPYFDDCHAVWSGYFSSRPALKHYVRDSSRVFQAAKQLQAAAAPPADMTESNPLYLLERAMGVTQHHDAVSGTSKQHVANDYARRLAGGRLAADQLVTDALATLTGYSDAAFLVCDLANVTICPVLEAAQPTVLVIYNQLAQDKTVHVRVPVGLPSGVASYKVFNSSAGAVAAQIVAPSQTDADLRVYYSYSSAVPVQWLAFNAPNVPAMGYAAYFLQPSATRETPAPAAAAVAAVAARKLRATGGADTVMSNGVVSLTFDGTTGLLKTYANSADGVNTPLAQAFMWWNSSTGNYHKDGCGDFDQSSGAYIVSAMQCNAARARPALFARARPALFAQARPALFAQARPALFAPALSPHVFSPPLPHRLLSCAIPPSPFEKFRPNNTVAFSVAAGPVATTVTASGPVVWEARQVFASWAAQTVRLYAGSNSVEFEYDIGPIPFADGEGKEIVSRFTASAIQSAATWISDSNGRDAQVRKRDSRRSFNYTVYEPVAGNFVPVNLVRFPPRLSARTECAPRAVPHRSSARNEVCPLPTACPQSSRLTLFARLAQPPNLARPRFFSSRRSRTRRCR